jgi:type VI secretion system protein VasG
VGLEARWEQEKALAARTHVRGRIEDAGKDCAAEKLDRNECGSSRACRVSTPLIYPVVDGQASRCESWTGIPAGRMQSDEIRTVLI